jgi:hypothetical protein
MNNAKTIFLYVLLFLISFFLFYNENYKKILGFEQDSNASSVYTASDAIESNNTELRFIYLTNSSCNFSSNEDVIYAINSLNDLIEEKANGYGISFSSLIISVDENSYVGIDHISKYDSFDEISTGKGWLNTNVIDLFEDQTVSFKIVPQILVTVRIFSSKEFNNSKHLISFQKEKFLIRKIGKPEIIDWYKKGAPLPKDFNQR